MSQTSRTCKKCSIHQPIEQFAKVDGGRSRRHECLACQKQRMRSWFDKNRDVQLQKVKERYRARPIVQWTPEQRAKANELAKLRGSQIRDEVYKHYGNECVACGETEPLFLTIDHVNNDGTEMRKVHGVGPMLYRWLKKKGYPSDFQLLCMNCNFGKARNGGVLVKDRRLKEGSTTRASCS